MADYTILMFNFNGYECFREPLETSPRAEYIYVTDNDDYKSDKWKIVHDSSLDKLTAFDKAFSVRFNPFKYATTDCCICIDGSVQLLKPIDTLYDAFRLSYANIGLMVHPCRRSIYDEYVAWIDREHDIQQYRKCIQYMSDAGYDTRKPYGLYEAGCRICKRSAMNSVAEKRIYDTLKLLAKEPGGIERIDQTISTFIFNTISPRPKVFPFSRQVLHSDYMSICEHGKPYDPDLKVGFIGNAYEEHNGYRYGIVYGMLERLFELT